MRLALVVLVLATHVAAADRLETPDADPGLYPSRATVVDPDAKIDEVAMLAALRDPAVAGPLAKCGGMSKTLLVWLVFDRGKVAAADAAGSGDRKLEACVVAAVRKAKLAGSASRVAASVDVIDNTISTQLAGAAPRASIVGGGSIGTGGGPGGGGSSRIGAPAPDRPHATVKVQQDVDIQGDLDHDMVLRTLRARIGTFRACYERGLERDPGLVGRMTLQIATGASGAVTSARVQQGIDSEVDACTARMMKTLKFPPTAATIVARLVFAQN